MSSNGSTNDSNNMVRVRTEGCATSNVSLVDAELLSDIIFVCGDDFVPIKSHKLILRSWSTFLSKIVECTLSIQGPFPVAPVIVLKEVPGKDLQDILKLIYTGDLIVEKSRIQSILRTAKFLEFEKLPEKLEASEMIKASITESVELQMDAPPPPPPTTTTPPPPTTTTTTTTTTTVTESLPTQDEIESSGVSNNNNNNSNSNQSYDDNHLDNIKTASTYFSKRNTRKVAIIEQSNEFMKKNDAILTPRTEISETIDLTHED